jgi:protein ImuA
MSPACSLPSHQFGTATLTERRLGEASAWLWRAGQMAVRVTPTASTGWPILDAELPGGGWPLAGLTELLATPASGELALLAPWLQALVHLDAGGHELLWVAAPGRPCITALQALGLAPQRLVHVTPATSADAAWATEQALRAGSCAAVLWWQGQAVTNTALRRLHLAAQAGATPLIALRPTTARTLSSPAPLRLACTPQAGRQLAIEVFKRRGPPMGAPLILALPWPASARRHPLPPRVRDAVDRPVPAPVAVAIPRLVVAGV